MIAFIIPIIAVILAFFLKSATGPYWQFPDPCYGYLSSSLSLLKGFSPTFNYQPGTTIQILGSVVMFLLNIGHSTAQTVRQVLLAPDFYLNAINLTMIVFAFITSLILGQYVYRQTGDKLATLLSQLPILSVLSLRSYSFYNFILPVIANVSPEPLMISVTCLFNLYFLKLYFRKEHHEEIHIAIILGFICGFGIATRLTFGVFLLIPLIICRGWLKFLFLSITILSCLLWTLPIIHSYAWIWNWIVSLATHQGGYGSGDKGFTNTSLYMDNWINISCVCSSLISFSIGALLISLVSIIKNPKSRETFFVWITAFNILLQLALIAKHFDDHYLVASLMLLGPLYVLIYVNVKDKNLIFKTIVLLGIIIFIGQSLRHAWEYNLQLSEHTKETVSFNNLLHTKYPGSAFVGVYPMPMSTPEAAFFWGNDRDIRQADELSNLYPNYLAYFSNNTRDYAPYLSGIYSIKQQVWADDLLASGTPVIFVAPKNYNFSQVTPYTTITIEEGKYASAYLLAKSTEKEANTLFEDSMKLYGMKDYQQAFIFALKSRELHYQPEGRVMVLISIIYNRIKH